MTYDPICLSVYGVGSPWLRKSPYPYDQICPSPFPLEVENQTYAPTAEPESVASGIS